MEPGLTFSEGTRMDTDLASLIPVEGVTEEKTETVVFPYMVHENH